jgi:hypothetical protein
MESAPVAVRGVGELASVTVTVSDWLPAAVGVPVMAPVVLLRERRVELKPQLSDHRPIVVGRYGHRRARNSRPAWLRTRSKRYV